MPKTPNINELKGPSYLVLEVGRVDGQIDGETIIHGPYKTRSGAARAIRRDAMSMVEESECLKAGVDAEMLSRCVVVYVVGVYHPKVLVTAKVEVRRES